MRDLYAAARAEGTTKNKRVQATSYIKFALSNGIDYYNPDVYDVAMYTAHLATRLTPGSLKNYLSGAKTWVVEMGGSPAPFLHPIVAGIIQGAVRTTSHVPSTKLGLTPAEVAVICRYTLKPGLTGLTARAAVLIGYYCMLRQSNLVAPPGYPNGGPHTLRRGDIVRTRTGLAITIQSSKTIRRGQGVTINIPPTGTWMCPVSTWDIYSKAVPARADLPAFMLPNGRPLSAAGLSAIMQAGLAQAGHPAPEGVTIHDLRRGSAHTCARLGCPIEEVKRQGTWKSDAVYRYAPKQIFTSAPRHLAAAFGRF